MVTGNPGEVTTPVSGGVALMGGGSDEAMVEAFRFLIERSGGGDLVVLRASGTDAYNSFIYELGGVDSVETLIVDSRAKAADPHVVVRVANAEALFIAGGNQADYLSFWDDTPLEAAIDAAIARGVPIGGTSAGLAILGEFDNGARNGTLTSEEALPNPYHYQLTLVRGFVLAPGLDGTITDSHFVEDGRMGRLVAFLARILQDGWASEANGIGIDRSTALIVEPGGKVTRVGAGPAYFLRTPGPPQECTAGHPLRFEGVSVYKLTGAASFNLATWQGDGGLAYTVSAADGHLTSTAPGGAVY
jgi:cyanophycinase